MSCIALREREATVLREKYCGAFCLSDDPSIRGKTIQQFERPAVQYVGTSLRTYT